MSFLRFFTLMFIKCLSKIFYRMDVHWISEPASTQQWRDIKLGILLNHTSLCEPIFANALPNPFLWRLASNGILPVADVTYHRPFVGLILRSIAAYVMPLTRKRDDSWAKFLSLAERSGVIMFAAEGRMRRPNGLDKDGKPLTVRGGVADIMLALKRGYVLVGYSGGLHHVQSPGSGFPKLFKTVKITFELLNLEAYLAHVSELPGEDLRSKVRKDLDRRRDAILKEVLSICV